MSTIITVISPVLDALGRAPFIVGALTKGTLLVRIVLGLTRLLASAPAAARHLVWSLAVVGLLLGTTQPQTTFFETCGRYSCKLPPRIS